MRTTNTAVAALIALGVLTVSGCNSGTDVSTTTTSTSSSSTSTTPSSTSTSSTSSTSSATPESGVASAEQAVTSFYKEMDELGQGKLDINKVTSWTMVDTDGSGTQNKWTLSVGKQVYERKILQVGNTGVTDLRGEKVAVPKGPQADADSAYSVTACVDRSGLTYEKDGKPVENPSGVAAKTLVTHLVVENGGGFRVARDKPGASC